MHDTDVGPGRPDADECLPYYFQDIGLVPDGHIVKLLERQIAESATFLAAFTPEQALWRVAPGEWNIVEIVGHLADTERVFEYRALRIARADPVMWTSVEFPDYLAAATSRRARSAMSWPNTRRCGPHLCRSRVAWTRRPGSAALRRTGLSAARAASPMRWPTTSYIIWRASADNTAASRQQPTAR